MFKRNPSAWPRWIERQLVRRGITDRRVLEVFCNVPREDFVQPQFRDLTLNDAPIPIGCRQTVSQPYVIALSLQGLELTGSERVLEVGTGSGFQAVLLSHLAKAVFTVEIHDKLYVAAHLPLERAPGRRLPDQPEPHRPAGLRTSHVASPNGVAVHGGSGKRRNRLRAADLIGADPSRRLRQRNDLAPERLRHFEHGRTRFLDRQHDCLPSQAWIPAPNKGGRRRHYTRTWHILEPTTRPLVP